MTSLQDVLDYIESHKEGDWETELRPVHLAMQKVDKERKDKKRKAIKEPCIEAKEVALYLADSITSHYPVRKLSPDKWEREIERLHTVDGFDWGTIKTVARFSQEDSFWQKQILSGSNFRKHFSRLLIQTKTYYEKKMTERTVKL